jgi:hypothetical protein
MARTPLGVGGVNLLLLASHAVAEFDDLRMFTDLGYDVFAPGGYETPSQSGEGIRPPLPDAPHHPEFVALCQREREVHGEPGPAIDWAKAHIPAEIIDWADAIIVHHFPEQWIAGQWERIRHKRVIWRTCGQSDPRVELIMEPLRRDGLQIVRYSPAERRYFESVGAFAGQDALIRFGKYPADYGPWIGDNLVVGNVTQNMVERGESCGLSFWLAATEGLPARPAGPGSEQLPGGIGALSYDEMREYLRRCRAYLYTGTTPASYTLGLIEAMLSGVPVVSIDWHDWAGPDDLFEGPEIATIGAKGVAGARDWLEMWLADRTDAALAGDLARQHAIRLFDVATVGPQWVEFLG